MCTAVDIESPYEKVVLSLYAVGRAMRPTGGQKNSLKEAHRDAIFFFKQFETLKKTVEKEE